MTINKADTADIEFTISMENADGINEDYFTPEDGDKVVLIFAYDETSDNPVDFVDSDNPLFYLEGNAITEGEGSNTLTFTPASGTGANYIPPTFSFRLSQEDTNFLSKKRCYAQIKILFADETAISSRTVEKVVIANTLNGVVE
jgi:hypothetical protein